ncbi:hypothetical protein MMAG44476_00050 [Mycolicibacterium mageritense DSM 44476 = CIP 104973]|uniref:Uncharacterized protein n=1 Tax=Mycolicibacterium mageritense TaxID=53462 RepID=A0AAI8TX51_MYCME|nr:hypothetical protein [Mycolicibacterium mageritense]MCC9180385.1 hypothetical protein [Mycolicibacterium mageritense]CDO19853.1 hypothetical protein BN978_00304 [Mycolicibacterium mageritense DSM 44476 = CIP 104973]BBX35641.1 hypothetical protein MMAGJ_49230 [Mycolicibacterium mageritense]BDY30540.1 hypothetical protein hbim_04484 [Mycolicibacterium mageritense]GJJ19284.1 hypothetical protein MTY414_29570 [Mycolicibacterium mageritense]
MTETLAIEAIIDGRPVSRTDVHRWESRRAEAVLKKFASRLGSRALTEILDDPIDSIRAADLATRRSALLAVKSRLGHPGIYAMLRHEIALSERAARLAVAASRGRQRHSVIELTAPGCSAGAFAEWFDALTTNNDEAAMLDACPDHYLLRGLPDGRQEVVETTGGSPMATRFLVDYSAPEAVHVPVHADYPVQIAGQAVLDDGLVIGGVRHQFRDADGRMTALLTVAFPDRFPTPMVAAHRWHLATEFSNWIEAFAATNG